MVTVIRPNQEFTVKANVSRGDTRLVSWIIFQGHTSNEANILSIYPKQGLELNHSFPNEGKFRLAAYNKEIQTKSDFQNSAELKHVDIEVKLNQLDGTKLIPKNSDDFLAGDVFRKDFPAVFEAKFLITPITQAEVSRLQFELEDNAGNTLNKGVKTSNTFTFTPRNSNAKYTVKAKYTSETGAVYVQSFSGTSKSVSVRDITHTAELIRPGTLMNFSVTKTQFGTVDGDSDLPEQESIKWNLDKIFIGTGRTITISGSQLMRKKKYHIEAYATSAIGKTSGSNTDSTKNDWHFEVKDNIVEKIKVIKKPKYGIEGEFEIEKMTFPSHDPAKDGAITWIVTGPESARSSEIRFKKIFSIPGTYTISCKIGGRECREPLTLEILQPEVIVDRCKWIDEDHKSGNIITEAGIKQKVCAFVHGNGLDNENLTVTVYDDDSAGRTDVYSCTFTTDESHKTGFYMPLTITQDVIDKIKKAGFSDYGDLYFNIIRNGSDLPVKNGDKKLGEYLKVTLEPKIVDAYFCDANDTQKLFSSSLDGALYFKIYAINLVGRKIEITFITESDAYWTWDDEMKIKDWKGIKNKFEDEKIRDTKTGTFNEKGEVLVPVDLSKMGKPKNFIRLNAMVKIFQDENAEEKQEEKGFYMQHNNLAVLYPGATLPTMAENKGAVKVGREKIQGGGNNNCDCKENYKDLVWGEKVSCDFRKKVVQICGELWGESRKMEMASGLMAVMKVETNGSFKAHQIMGKPLKNMNTITKDDFWLVTKDKKTGKEKKTSRAVGLIQFTQAALETIGEFKGGSGFDKLHEVKLNLAKMGEIKQLDYVKKYFEGSKEKIKTPEDIYLHVFAPAGVGKDDDYQLYKKGTLEYTQNKSVDIENKGKKYGDDGVIQRVEILERYKGSISEGSVHKVKTFTCGNFGSQDNTGKSGFYIYKDGTIKYIKAEDSIAYYVQIKEGSNDFVKVNALSKNSFGLVKFPDSGSGFNRYGTVDSGGKSTIEDVGSGDHYLLPETAAALFGIVSEVKDKNWEIHFGDMSSENGSDPTSSPSKTSSHHAGHGHKGKQSGLNIDFRYLNKNGTSFQGVSSSTLFDDSKNKEFFKIAFKYGFNKNYATGKSYSGVNSKVGGHYDHGHIGALSIAFETVESVDTNITQ
ncbi:hypothetical protein [Chryseobacterium sp. Leaf394]|uniref:hypothetical protein n=1 Tax=Chryseobacterium sp. Leaf394 TaxID=1736361 RepID=UPI0006F8ED3D|nr:hypothetical protein [Chryseobacterium sp. Leaf394]KQS89909.1 hypothetical protein ASG21_13095 [Chryseobacterium sp. Leaf394]